jgi:hypothetical protein
MVFVERVRWAAIQRGRSTQPLFRQSLLGSILKPLTSWTHAEFMRYG